MQVALRDNSEQGNDYLAIARRNRGWILGPLFASLTLSVVVAYWLPDTFRSKATARVQLRSDLPPLSETVVNEQAHSMMSVLVLSRMGAQSIIQTYGLYPKDLTLLPLEEVIENLKRNVHVGRVESIDAGVGRAWAFSISFDYSDRFKAQRVVTDLASRLTLVNRDTVRGASSAPASQASPDREALDSAAKNLEASEDKIAEFKSSNEGKLPGQAASNQEAMSALRMGLTKVQGDIARVSSELADLRVALATQQEKRRGLKDIVAVPEAEKVENLRLAAYDTQILAIEEQIKALKVQYTDNFPDVKSARERVERIKHDRDALVQEEAAKGSAVKQRSEADLAKTGSIVDTEIARLQSQVGVKTGELEKLNRDSLDSDRNIQAILAKAAGSTDLEKKYAELLADRDSKKSKHEEERIRFEAAAAARPIPAAVEGRPGAVFDLLDTASLPVAPIEPNRLMIVGTGSVLGLVTGLVVAGMREVNGRALRNLYGIEKDRPIGRTARIVWPVAIVIGAGAMAASVIRYYAARV